MTNTNKKRAYRLVDIEPDEVSIVTEGANQKRFIIRKSTTDINHTKDGTLSTTEKEQMQTQSTEKPAVEDVQSPEAPAASETPESPAVEAPAVEAQEADVAAPEAPSTDSVEKDLREEVAKLSSELEAIKASVTKSLSTVPAPSTTQTEVKKNAPTFTWAHDLNSTK